MADDRKPARSLLIKALLLSLIMFGLWLLMSGIYDKPLILGLGVLSSFLVGAVAWRLDILKHEVHHTRLRLTALARYIFWLVFEIGKADWAITKVIVSKTYPRQQRLLRVPCQQAGDVAKMLFANSITITPGTITVETEADHLIIHALTDEAADREALADMGRRVSDVEKPVG